MYIFAVVQAERYSRDEGAGFGLLESIINNLECHYTKQMSFEMLYCFVYYDFNLYHPYVCICPKG